MKTIRFIPLLAILVTGNISGLSQPTNADLPFNALYCFGFSWTDTQGLFPDGSPDFVNNSPLYWQNRASNGPMWPEFASTNLGLAYLPANNLARGGAVSSDTLAQVNHLPSHSNPERGLYVIWAAAGDFLSAADSSYGAAINWTNETAWNAMMTTALRTSSNTVESLYAKGARSIVIQNCLDLSLAPGVVSDVGANADRLAQLKERTARFNSDLAATLENLQRSKPDLRLFIADIFRHENEVYANPALYGFTSVSADAIDNLLDKSFNGPGKDYMFWDRLHGTSKFHELVAAWTLESLTNTVLENLKVTPSAILPQLELQMSHLQIGRQYTLQSSTDLNRWQDEVNFVPTSGTNRWTASLQRAPAGFYRLLWQR